MPQVSVIGTGYVGLVSACGLAKLGHQVLAMDIDGEKIALLKQGKSPLMEQGLDQLLAEVLARGTIRFTTDLKSTVESSEYLMIAVNTPVGADGSADPSQVLAVAEGVARFMGKYKIIAIKSTVPISTCEMVEETLKKNGRSEGRDYDLTVNPEFLREGNAVYDFFNPTRIIVGAHNREAGKKVMKLYAGIDAPRLLTSIVNAQIIKYAANAFLATRISFINELANICEAVGADITEIASGITCDPRIGAGYLEAGVGFGGPCLPKDMLALIRMAEEKGYSPHFLNAVYQKNEHQLRSIVLKTKAALTGSVANKTIGVLGLTFKAGTDDLRHSLAIKIIEQLLPEGAFVNAYDPITVPRPGIDNTVGVLIPPGVALKADAQSACRHADLILILTGWPEFRALDWAAVRTSVRQPIVVDGVNLLEPAAMGKLGFTYIGVGRGERG